MRLFLLNEDEDLMVSLHANPKLSIPLSVDPGEVVVLSKLEEEKTRLRLNGGPHFPRGMRLLAKVQAHQC
ncbi:hypothetical protein DAPPUDRAFT_265080 [Daphnia pulex]|uniref:Uncharacterized protein n=1 Tax=Daphnia pulex TaxID=6669 RepID=E9HSU5_DAPPU|nr:hypothetical protein DAPPUDRAFT_265080 [Daphnia pulex]|eukprot:EFX65175.1 hypothetical protein DAPPUDRAFT_265080 [Daphnia pulex]